MPSASASGLANGSLNVTWQPRLGTLASSRGRDVQVLFRGKVFPGQSSRKAGTQVWAAIRIGKEVRAVACPLRFGVGESTTRQTAAPPCAEENPCAEPHSDCHGPGPMAQSRPGGLPCRESALPRRTRWSAPLRSAMAPKSAALACLTVRARGGGCGRWGDGTIVWGCDWVKVAMSCNGMRVAPWWEGEGAY